MTRHLLIISCSNNKDHQKRLMPAIQRYTGASYGVINKLKREGSFPTNLDVLIISAKYGLILSDELIEDYDRKMDISRARELNEPAVKKLKEILQKTDYESILINLGREYMETIRGFEEVVAPSQKIFILKGKIGSRKRELRNWLISIFC